MQIKNLLISVASYLLLTGTHFAWAEGCDDLLIYVHNNTKAPVFLLYNTQHTTSDITETRIIPASQTIILNKLIPGSNLWPNNYTQANLLLVSISIPNQINYHYAVSKFSVWKYYNNGNTLGEIDYQPGLQSNNNDNNVLRPIADYQFKIPDPKEKIINGYCGAPAVAKPGEITIEVNDPINI